MGGPEHDSGIVEPLRVGLIADAEGLQQLAEALTDPALEIVAQAGMRQPEALPGPAWHDDVRAMIAQAGLQALIVATAPRAACELDAVLGEQSPPVWRLPPLARNFPEAVELVRRVQQRRMRYCVASWWEAVAGDVRWALRYREGFKPLLSMVRVGAKGPSAQSWRASLADGPGGVLASDAYPMLEALIAIRKVPERVYASLAQIRRRPGEPPRETEGAALAILRYDSGASALIEAAWDLPPFRQIVEHVGTDLTIAVEPAQVEIRAADGTRLDRRTLPAQAFLRENLTRFTEAVRSPLDMEQQDAAIERHLAVLALLEATYLSARTGQPESPRKFYEVQGWPEPR